MLLIITYVPTLLVHIHRILQEGRIPPAEMLDPACITRNILADKPRVTRFPIDWNAAPAESGGTPEVNGAASEEGGMEVDEMAMTVEEEGVVYEEEGVVYEEEMGAGGDSTHIGAEVREGRREEGRGQHWCDFIVKESFYFLRR